VADAVRNGRDRLAALRTEEQEARRHLVAAQHELQHILQRITRSDDTLIDLTGTEVRFGLAHRSAARRSGALPPVAPAVQAPGEEIDLEVMVRRAVEVAATCAGTPAVP
jgi:hypothetical protein